MRYFRVQMRGQGRWKNTVWGNEDNYVNPDTVFLSLERAKAGVKLARERYPDKRYIITQLERSQEAPCA